MKIGLGSVWHPPSLRAQPNVRVLHILRESMVRSFVRPLPPADPTNRPSDSFAWAALGDSAVKNMHGLPVMLGGDADGFHSTYFASGFSERGAVAGNNQKESTADPTPPHIAAHCAALPLSVGIYGVAPSHSILGCSEIR